MHIITMATAMAMICMTLSAAWSGLAPCTGRSRLKPPLPERKKKENGRAKIKHIPICK